MNQEKYFSLRNSIFDYKLTRNEFLVYSYLTKCSNRKTGISWPSVPTIAKDCGIGETTVRTSTKNLEKVELIKIQQNYEYDKSNRQTSNRYFLQPIHAGFSGSPSFLNAHPQRNLMGKYINNKNIKQLSMNNNHLTMTRMIFKQKNFMSF